MDDRLTARPSGVDVACFRYSLPLVSPVEVAGVRMEFREGILLRLTDASGREGWGEAAPLPGFSHESMSDVIDACRSWADGSATGGPPSLAFAIDSAIAALESHPSRLLSGSKAGIGRRSIELNALIADTDDLQAQIDQLQGGGYRAVKLKVGRRAVDDDIGHVMQLRRLLKPAVSIRLDANRAWDMDQAVWFLEAVGAAGIEYIEEPLREPELLRDLAAKSTVPIALDETVREMDSDDLEPWSFCGAVILKPSLVGTFGRYDRLVSDAARLNMKVVLSGAFESGVGTQRLVAMAAELPQPTPCGFAPYRRLAEDIFDDRLPMAKASVEIEAALARRSVRLELLEEV